MTFPSVKSKVHLFADDTMIIYLVVKSLVDCLQLQQDLLSLETGYQIEKWISIPLNVEKERKKRKFHILRIIDG